MDDDQARIKEIFSLFREKCANESGLVPVGDLGVMLRALGLLPTEAEVADSAAELRLNTLNEFSEPAFRVLASKLLRKKREEEEQEEEKMLQTAREAIE